MHQKINWNNLDYSSVKIRLKKLHQNNVDFLPNKVILKKSMSKKCWYFTDQNYVNKNTSKRRRLFAYRNYNEESTLEWHRNSSIFSFRRIFLILTSNRRGFNVAWPMRIKWSRFSNIFVWSYFNILYLVIFTKLFWSYLTL